LNGHTRMWILAFPFRQQSVAVSRGIKQRVPTKPDTGGVASHT
jgi:hypothetical protein